MFCVCLKLLEAAGNSWNSWNSWNSRNWKIPYFFALFHPSVLVFGVFFSFFIAFFIIFFPHFFQVFATFLLVFASFLGHTPLSTAECNYLWIFFIFASSEHFSFFFLLAKKIYLIKFKINYLVRFFPSFFYHSLS